MAFSVVASSSLLSSRVSTPLKKQNKRNSRNSHAFSCKAMSDAEIDAKYPVGGSVYKVVLDCSQSNIALGLLLKPGEDGRPVVKTVRPGGKALGKVSVGDTILATTYVGLTNISEDSWGKADRGWVDTAAVSYDDANAAMTTNANTIGLILDHEYKPSGGGARAVTSSNGEDAKAWAKAKAAELKAKRSR